MINFAVNDDERDAIRSIVDRALRYAVNHRLPIRTGDMPAHVELEMDITAVHCNGCQLRLRDLLASDDFNFVHDVFGIRRYLNRENGTLTQFFVPRFAVNQ